MKIIATGDWHLGNLFHGNDRLPEHRHFLQWLLDELTARQPDALLIAGDVFDNGNPSAAAQSAYYEFMADATAACPAMQIVITAGNHDSASRLEAPRPLLARHRVEIRGQVRRRWLAGDSGPGRWDNDFDDLIIPLTGADGTRVAVLAVPFLRSDVVNDGNYSRGVNAFLRRLTARARELHPGHRLLMMAHMYAKGADIHPTDASEKIVIGGQEEVNMEGWADHPDYLTCGHIHKRQHIRNTDWARYSGSVLPMSFAEKDYTHGVDLVSLETEGRAQVSQLVYEPTHRLRVIPEGDEALSPRKLARLIDKTLPPLTGSATDEHAEYVALRVTMDRVNNDDIRMLEERVAGRNAILCKIQKILPTVATATLCGADTISSIDDILGRDPLDTLRESFTVKHGRDMLPRQEQMLAEVIAAMDSDTEPNPDTKPRQ